MPFMARQTIFWAIALLCSAVLGCAAQRPRPSPGLTVSEEGVLTKEGTPFRGIGVNVFDLFNRTLANPNDTSYEQALRTVGNLKIPFVRFAACGFWPRDMQLYQRDKEAYFRLMDAVVDCARRNGVGLMMVCSVACWVMTVCLAACWVVVCSAAKAACLIRCWPTVACWAV